MAATPDLSVFWYTHSTICQTLASAFGFLTAVCLYQMQSLSTSLQGSMRIMRGQPNDPNNVLQTLEYSGDFRSFETYVNEHGFIGGTNPTNPHQVLFERFKEKIRTIDVLASSLRNSLIATSLTIIGSLLCLLFTNAEWISEFSVAWRMLAVMVVLAIVCVASYVYLALAVVGGQKYVNELEKFWASLKT